MLGNWINWGDLAVAWERLLDRGPGSLRRLLAPSTERTRTQWQQAYRHAPAADPLAIPGLQRRWRLKATGDPEMDFREYVSSRYLGGRRDLAALSLCSGPGWNEAAWARSGCFSRIDGIELSPELVADASRRAREAGLDAILHFRQGDAGRPPWPREKYDLVLSEGALHHLSPLERVLPALASVLAPGGLLVMTEFCGPDRFQWTRGQLRLARRALALIPPKLRLKGNGRIKKTVLRPGRLRMLLADPSEAAESSRILPLLRRHFVPVEEKPLGGTVVNLVFWEIAGNFLKADEEAAAVLEKVCRMEEQGLSSGGIASDYWFGVYRARQAPEVP